MDIRSIRLRCEIRSEIRRHDIAASCRVDLLSDRQCDKSVFGEIRLSLDDISPRRIAECLFAENRHWT
jgi:hypothetical protein